MRLSLTSNDGISQMISTILLLGIIVALASVIYLIVLSNPLPENNPKVDLVATLQSDAIVITHKGGHPLDKNTTIEVAIGNTTTYHQPTRDIIEDGQWTIGEYLLIPYDFQDNQISQQASIKVVDTESNIMRLIGTMELTADCDLGINFLISPKNYSVEYEIINLTVTNYDEAQTASDITITFHHPLDLNLSHINCQQGNYSESIDVWTIPSLQPDTSTTLSINARAKYLGSTGQIKISATIQSSTPYDPYPENNYASITLFDNIE